MRTEVKIGLVIAMAVIAGGIFWAVRQGGTAKTPGEIPLDGKRIEQNSSGARSPAGSQPAGGVKSPANTPPAGPIRNTPPRSTPPPATTNQPVSPTSPSATHRDASPQDSQPKPPGEAPRLPPLANDPRGTTETSRPATPLTAPPLSGAASAPAATRPAFSPESSPPRGPSATTPPATPTREPGVATPPLREPPPRGDDLTTRLQPMEKPQPGSSGKPPSAPTGGSKPYTVREGDTLSSIARELLGDEDLWPRIAAANPGLNPDIVKVGQALNIPGKDGAATPATSGGANRGATPTATTPPPARADAATPEPAPRAGGSTYVVGKGDTLRSIARNVLKDASKWRQIYDLNKDKLQSPDVISEGTELRLPPLNGAAKPPANGAGKTAGNGAAKPARPTSKPSSPSGGARR